LKYKTKVIITAGFDKSSFAVCVAELLQRKDVSVEGIVVVNPFAFKRVVNTVRKKGVNFILEAIPRLIGKIGMVEDDYSPLKEFQRDEEIEFNSLKKWAHANNVSYTLVPSINHIRSEQFIKNKKPNYLIYGGGGIIRSNIIDAVDGNILNAHLGPLPEIRGMNAIEWSVLLNERNEITIHFIDHGIDTGKIVKSYPMQIEKGDTIEVIREKAKVKGVEGLVDAVSNNLIGKANLKENTDSYRQCFILSNTMKELLKSKLQNFK